MCGFVVGNMFLLYVRVSGVHIHTEEGGGIDDDDDDYGIECVNVSAHCAGMFCFC